MLKVKNPSSVWNKQTKNNIGRLFLSLDEVVGDLRNHVRPSVRPSIRSLVTQFLENLSLLFSETLQLGRTWIGNKNVPSGFSKKNS